MTLSSPTSAARRYGFVDLLRGYALLVMIETHVINSYLPMGSRHNWFFFWLTFFNGLVAPAFLFASGYSIILQAGRDWGKWLRFHASFWLRIRRLGFILLVAYYTHLQHFKVSKYLYPEGPDLWKKTLQVDILQCIVASLLVVQVLVLVLRNRVLVAWGAGFLAAVVALLTPWMWAQDFTTRLPLSLALFLNPHGVSIFPLFPWLCFLLSGSVAAHFFLKSVEARRDTRHMRNVFVLGVVMIAAGYLLQWAPFTLPGQENLYTTSPLYVSIRLGCVLLLSAILYTMERFLHMIPRAVEVAGQESLLVYGVHLWLIFAVFRGKHLGPILGTEAGYTVCFLLSAGIIVAMLYLAKGWQRLKRTYPKETRAVQAGIVLLMILVFLLR